MQGYTLSRQQNKVGDLDGRSGLGGARDVHVLFEVLNGCSALKKDAMIPSACIFVLRNFIFFIFGTQFVDTSKASTSSSFEISVASPNLCLIPCAILSPPARRCARCTVGAMCTAGLMVCSVVTHTYSICDLAVASISLRRPLLLLLLYLLLCSQRRDFTRHWVFGRG